MEHRVTCTDEIVRGRPGTVARCSCTWSDAWGIQDGSAEASGDYHVRRMTAAQGVAPTVRLDDEGATHITIRTTETARRERCHDCSCHLNPPCGHCVNCAHADHPDCPNDCQTCTDHEKDR